MMMVSSAVIVWDHFFNDAAEWLCMKSVFPRRSKVRNEMKKIPSFTGGGGSSSDLKIMYIK